MECKTNLTQFFHPFLHQYAIREDYAIVTGYIQGHSIAPVKFVETKHTTNEKRLLALKSK
jgi:hypothetical protein